MSGALLAGKGQLSEDITGICKFRSAVEKVGLSIKEVAGRQTVQYEKRAAFFHSWHA